jgi:hypothetical protein
LLTVYYGTCEPVGYVHSFTMYRILERSSHIRPLR